MRKRLDQEALIFNKSFARVFPICLFFSFSLWAFFKLSKEYVREVVYQVEYVNLPLEKVFSRKPWHKLFIQQRSDGYTLLKKALFGRNVVQIEVDKVIYNNGMGAFWEPVKHVQMLSEKINHQSIINVSPSLVWLPLSDKASKIVPVKPDISFEYKEGFGEKSLVIKPDSVHLMGSVKAMQKLNQVSTEKWNVKELSKDTLKTLNLILPDGVVKESIPKIKVQLEVEPYTEKVMEVPIKAINLPDGFQAQIVPERALLIFKVSYEKYSRVSRSDFLLVFNVEEYIAGMNHLVLSLQRAPYFIKDVKIMPEKVEVIGLVKSE